MADAKPQPIPMADLPVGAAARITQIRGGRELARRLLGLGLRVGSEVRVLHHRGGGLVVSSGEARVALGGGVVDKLWVEPLPDEQAPQT
ncbi:MAG: ferrous iron transport protein A [Chromatiaceae bacterium]|jgi:ferrous iron transport protein A|nr:ferrous iron transport protein A [Chromatiaceae bacterium]